MRRGLRQSYLWIRRNRPSGLVILLLIAFIIAYTIIVKLDRSYRDTRDKTVQLNIKKTTESALRYANEHGRDSVSHSFLPSPGSSALHLNEGLVGDSLKHNDHNKQFDSVLYSLNNVPREPGVNDDQKDDDNSIELPGNLSENEQLMNDELERNEEEIEAGWNKYLNKDNSNSKPKSNSNKQIYLNQQHLKLQGVRLLKKNIDKSIYTHLPKNVHVYNVFTDSKQERESITKNKCILLKTLHVESPICIHDPEDDEIISRSLVDKGTWEPNYLYITGSVLNLYADMVLLDLGCNIGVYTILAAKLGHPVVAVDPYKVNLRLLTKSLSLGSVRDRVTLLWNAVSNVHENVTVNEIIGNVGGTYVEPIKNTENMDDFDVATTLILDDLIDIFIDKAVFIKMDVETFELKALEGGKNFFKRIDVRFVLMEWIAHRGSTNADKIIKLMTDYGLLPHVNAHHNTQLEPEHSASWPDNVLWIKY